MSLEKNKIDPVKSVENATEAMSRAKALLTTARVEDLPYCEAELAAAIESLENLRQSLDALATPAASGIKEATQQIRRDVSEFADLLRQAREFNAGLGALTDAGGYDQAGVPARVDRDNSRVALKG